MHGEGGPWPCGCGGVVWAQLQWWLCVLQLRPAQLLLSAELPDRPFFAQRQLALRLSIQLRVPVVACGQRQHPCAEPASPSHSCAHPACDSLCRFSQNLFVVHKDFRLVFYVMAPLISSNGHRVGTLCIMGQQPRKFDATRGAILANLSELLVRPRGHASLPVVCLHAHNRTIHCDA